MSEIHICRNLGAHIFLPDDRDQDRLDTFHITLFQRLQVFQLIGVETGAGIRFIDFAQKAAVLVHYRDIFEGRLGTLLETR